jgi:hypothetical protein
MDVNVLKRVFAKLPGSVLNTIGFIRGPITYCEDGLLTIHNADFMKDPAFSKAYELGKATGSWGKGDPSWRVYICCWAALRGKSLEGDLVECGVNKGGFSRAVMQYINFQNLHKHFWLLDTFCGLSDKYITEEERTQGIATGTYVECYSEVVETFKEFENVHIIRGTVPDTLVHVNAKKVCYLSIDMNCVGPEIAAADFFWDKLVSGAVIVLDDYGWKKHIHQKRAFDEFAKGKNVHILSLPTGQGLIFKP